MSSTDQIPEGKLRKSAFSWSFSSVLD